MATATAAVTPRLKQRYNEEIRPAFFQRFGLSSVMQAPPCRTLNEFMCSGEGA